MSYTELALLTKRCGHYAAARKAFKQGVPFALAFHAIFGKSPKLNLSDAWGHVLVVKGT